MPDPHLPHALRILARDIHCEDGIATQCIREAADEIERLRSQPCPYVTGNVTRYCTLTPFTLTDEEREAVEAILVDADSAWSADNAAALRGLLERCSQFAKRESDRPQPIAKRESDRSQPIECTPEPQSTPAECSVPPECTDTGEAR